MNIVTMRTIRGLRGEREIGSRISRPVSRSLVEVNSMTTGIGGCPGAALPNEPRAGVREFVQRTETTGHLFETRLFITR